MIGIPSMDNYIIQYEGKRWKEEGLMTKRHPMVCHDSSSWSFGVKKEIFSSLGQKERLILKGNYGDPHRSDLTLLFTFLRAAICGAALHRGIRIGIFRRDVL